MYKQYDKDFKELKESFPDGLIDLVEYIDNQKDPFDHKQAVAYEHLNQQHRNPDAMQDIVSLAGEIITNKPRQTGLESFSHLDTYVTTLIQSTSADNQSTGA